MALTFGQLKRIQAERGFSDDMEIVIEDFVGDYQFYRRPTRMQITDKAGKIKKNDYAYSVNGRGARTVVVLK